MEKILSVIIPVYNLESVIGRCIESILNQSFTNFEVLIIDDGSTDKTRQICERYLTDYRVIYHYKTNGGVSSARNYGLTKSEGEWVTFIDGDDYVEPDYFSTLLTSLNNIDLIVSGVKFSNKEGKSLPSCEKIISISEDNKDFIDNELCKIYFRTPWAKLFKREIILNYQIFFNTNLHIGEDSEFVFRYIGYINNIRLIPFCGYCYKVDFYEQARKHAMNTVVLYNHLDAILWKSGLKTLRERLHYNFPMVDQLLKIYFRRLYYLYLVSEVNTYSDFKKEIKKFKQVRLRYYDKSKWKEVIITFILRYFPFIAYKFVSRYK